jgi:branched-chain amino acid aminotransferase
MAEVSAYICLNGDFLKAGIPCLLAGNRAFRYGDSLCENIHAFATEPQFLELHFERLSGNMQQLSMIVPPYFNVPNLRGLIVSLLNKNRIFGGAGIRLTVYRSSGEEAVPRDNAVSFMIESYALAEKKYALNEKGLTLGISTYVKYTGALSHLHCAHALLYLLAGIESKRSHTDAVILLNESGRLVESINSNIFLVSGNSIFTPGLDQGCIPGIMRRVISELAVRAGYRINDQSSLTPAALHDAGEVFLTNAVEGIRWAVAYQQNRYFSKTAKRLTGMLNELAFKDPLIP